MKLNDLEKHLKNHNCVNVRNSGHKIWKNMSNNKIAPVPHHKEINKFLVKKICQELEIPYP